MKIAVLVNKGTNEKFVEKEIENLNFFNNINKNFGLNNIPYTYEVIDIDFDVNVKKKGQASDGTNGYTLKELPDIPLGYDFVCIMYDGVPIFSGGGNYAYSHPKPINGAYVSEIPDSSNDHVLPHELMHLICNKLKDLGYKVIDQMDSTKVNGKWIPYHKNNTPTANLGNYHVTLLSIDKYTKFLSSKTNPLGLPDAVWKLILSFVEANKKPKYKNFSELEVKGLNHDFVLLLDKAREFTRLLTEKYKAHKNGIPFIINSGFRTPEHNKRVGGVSNSSHLTGNAVDLKAMNDEEQWFIVRSLMEFDCVRITVYTKSNHIHCDMDTTLSYPRLTVLNK